MSAADTILSVFNVEGLNVRDGSFVLSKLASEFGILGCLFGIAIVVCIFSSMYRLRNKRDRDGIQLSRCIFVCFLVDFIARGTGYFTGSTLLAVSAMFALVGNYLSEHPSSHKRFQLRPEL